MLYRGSIFVLVLLFVLGCGGPSASTGLVEGVVLYNNKPLADATVQFVTPQGHISHGKTDADGKFAIKTPEGTGTLAGVNGVLVTATKQGQRTAEMRYPPVTSLIPENFGQQGLSGMSYEVKEGSTNRVKIELSSNGQGTVSAAE